MAQVYTMRDLNPMQFFRGPAPEAKPDASQASKDGAAVQKKPMTKVPSLLFDIEVNHILPFPAKGALRVFLILKLLA